MSMAIKYLLDSSQFMLNEIVLYIQKHERALTFVTSGFVNSTSLG